MRLVLRLLLLATILLVVSFTVGQHSTPEAAGTIVPDSNSVAFWCGSEDAGVKLEPVATPFVVPSPPTGIASWSLLVLKAGSGDEANETFPNPVVGQSYVRSDGKQISHVILCFGPPVTTTTHPTTTTCPDCVPDTQGITTTTQASTTTANSTSTSSSSTTSTSTSTSSTSSSTTTCPDCGTNPLTVPTTPGTTIATTTTAGGGGAGGGGTTLATTAAPTTTTATTTAPTTTSGTAPTTSSSLPVAATDQFVVTSQPGELPRTGASGDLYWMAVGASVAICIGLFLVARMAPRRR